MKLIRLKIEDKFRSLKKDFELSFRQPVKTNDLLEFHPFCFAGLNGSGKSNVLEALSNIFYHLECIINDYPVFAYDAKESSPDAFELEYFIAEENAKNDLNKLNHIFIKKKTGNIPQLSVDGGGLIDISKNYGRSFMPDLVVAYSSGENETISLPYIKMKLFQYDQYIKDLRQKAEFSKPKSSLLYIDYEMSQAVLLTILLFFDFQIETKKKKEDKKKGVLSTLEQEVKISGIGQFTLNIFNYWQQLINDSNEDQLIEVQTVFEDRDIQNNDDTKSYIGRIIDNIQVYIDKLKDCATCSFTKGNYTSLDFLINQNTIQLIRKKFDNDPYKFFSVFQVLHSLNERVEENEYKFEVYNSKGYYTDYKRPEYDQFFYFTNYYIKKKEENGDIINLLLRQLSDGEQQFLHTLGICLMLKNKRTLLLLDEPETHFNPDWRSKFIYILRKTLETGNDNFLFKEIILTSHSPFIIADCYPDKVIVFKKDKQPIDARKLKFNTFGTSVNIVLEEIFKKEESIPNYSLSKLNEIKNRDFNDPKDIEKAKEDSRLLGESPEKVFLFRDLLLKEEELKKKLQQ
jgi:restriction system-associated AAA family ATPase